MPNLLNPFKPAQTNPNLSNPNLPKVKQAYSFNPSSPFSTPAPSSANQASPAALQRQLLYKLQNTTAPNVSKPNAPPPTTPAPNLTPTQNPNVFFGNLPAPPQAPWQPPTPPPPNVPLAGFNPDETSIFKPGLTPFGEEIDPYDTHFFPGGSNGDNAPPFGGVGFRPDDNLGAGAQNYTSTDPGLQNFPGFPASIADYAKGDNALAANIEEEFIKIAQGWSTGNDAILQQGLDVLTDLGFPSGEINAFLGQMRQIGPFGATGQVSGQPSGSPVIGPGGIPAAQATIPEHFNRASFDEDEARAAILQDLSIERNSDLARRGQQQQYLLGQIGRLDNDPLAQALSTDVMDRLKNPNSITDEIKEQMFGRMADQASTLENQQFASLASRLGGSGLEGSGIGAGLGAQFAQERQKSLMGARRDVEIQQAQQAAQDRAAAQASANAFFQGREGLLGSMANNIASVGIGGGIGQTLGREAPNMPSDIAMANFLENYDPGGGGLGSILGGIGGLLAAPATGGLSLGASALNGLFPKT